MNPFKVGDRARCAPRSPAIAVSARGRLRCDRDVGPVECRTCHGSGDRRAFAWLLDNVRAIDPVPMKGAQGLRNLPADVAEKIGGAA